MEDLLELRLNETRMFVVSTTGKDWKGRNIPGRGKEGPGSENSQIPGRRV